MLLDDSFLLPFLNLFSTFLCFLDDNGSLEDELTAGSQEKRQTERKKEGSRRLLIKSCTLTTDATKRSKQLFLRIATPQNILTKCKPKSLENVLLEMHKICKLYILN